MPAPTRRRRGPETLTELVDELGRSGRAATAAEAAAAGDLVVVTVPLKAYRAVPVEPLRGEVVIDKNNHYPQRDGQIAEGWRYQRDTAASVQPYAGPSWDADGPGSQVTAEQLKELLAAAKRYRDA